MSLYGDDSTIWGPARRGVRALRGATSRWREAGFHRRDTHSAAEQAELDVSIVDLGPPGAELTLRDEAPRRLAFFKIPLLEVDDRARVAASADGCLPPSRSWGVSITVRNLPPEMPALESEPPIAGPYPAEAQPDLPQVVAELAAMTWLHVQVEALANQAAVLDLHAGLRQIQQAYVEDLLVRGATTIDDVQLRERYLELARRHQEADDPRRAAECLLVALATLQPQSFTVSSQTYTITHTPLAAGAGDEHVAANVLREFGELSKPLADVRIQHHLRSHRLSLLAREGVAVWREYAITALQFHQAIYPLPGVLPEITPATVVARYEHADPTSVYVDGFRLAATVAERISPWPLTAASIGTWLLYMPLELVGARITVTDLERLPADSPVTPNERLRRLAAVPDEEERENPWPAVAYEALDRDSLSIPALIDDCLARQERECP